MNSIDYELNARRLLRTDTTGDLILVAAGGMEFGLYTPPGAPILPTFAGPPPTIDATMWTGAGGASNLMAPYVPEGMLILTFVDRSTNKVIWSGTATQKLDVEKKEKSLELIDKAITKLLKDFPPKKK